MSFNFEEVKNKIVLADCMDIMKDIPDKYFDLAIVDPPYGISSFKQKRHGSNRIDKSEKIGLWDNAPDSSYFSQLFRISNKFIIWGANNFTLPPSEYFIIWDKKQTVSNFAQAEYAWTNCAYPAKVFSFSWAGFIQENMKQKEVRIHPTQKPVALYKWLLNNYAKQGDKIIDTHSGSGSCAIACMLEGFDFLAIEKDEDYFKDSSERYRLAKEKNRMRIF